MYHLSEPNGGPCGGGRSVKVLNSFVSGMFHLVLGEDSWIVEVSLVTPHFAVVLDDRLLFRNPKKNAVPALTEDCTRLC